jgi:hypothetical protein
MPPPENAGWKKTPKSMIARSLPDLTRQTPKMEKPKNEAK